MTKGIMTTLKHYVARDLYQHISYDEIKDGFSFYLYSNILLRVRTNFKLFNRIEIISNSELKTYLPNHISVSQKQNPINNGTYIYQIDVPKNNSIEDVIAEIGKAIEYQSEYIFITHTPKLTYGCCGLYLECSNERRCLQKDKDREYAKGCAYKTHLENGKIFYGQNKNI